MAGTWYYKNDSIVWYHKPRPPVITASASVTPTKTASKKSPGFEAFVAVGAIAAAIVLLRRRH